MILYERGNIGMSNSDDLTVVDSLADMLDGQMAKGVLAEEGIPCLIQDAIATKFNKK